MATFQQYAAMPKGVSKAQDLLLLSANRRFAQEVRRTESPASALLVNPRRTSSGGSTDPLVERARSPLYIGIAKQLGINSLDNLDELKRVEDYLANGGKLQTAQPQQQEAPPPPVEDGPFAQEPQDAITELVRQQLEASRRQQDFYMQMQQDLLARLNAAQSIAAGGLRVSVNGQDTAAAAKSGGLSGLAIQTTQASGTIQRKPSKFLQNLAITTPGTGLNLAI